MPLLFGLVSFAIVVSRASRGNVVLATWNETSIECASNAELTFKFISRKLNISLTIAECDIEMQSCRMLKTALETKYNLSYTGRGGILRITSLDEDTSGTYECFETYNSHNLARIDIISRSMDHAYNSTDHVPVAPCSNLANKTNIAPYIATSICAVIGIEIVFFLGFVFIKKKCGRRVVRTEENNNGDKPRETKSSPSLDMCDEQTTFLHPELSAKGPEVKQAARRSTVRARPRSSRTTI